MDQSTLVERHIDAGRRLVQRLIADGQPVDAGFWARSSDENFWYLYVVTDLYDRLGPRETYRAIDASLRPIQPLWLTLSAVKAIGPRDPRATAVIKIMKQLTGEFDPQQFPGWIAGTDFEQAYIYPPDLFSRTQQVVVGPA